MAMTPIEMVSFFQQQSALFSGGIDIAVASQNYHLAVSNIGQVFKACLMQGLIGWRCRLVSPVQPFLKAVHQIESGINLLGTFGVSDGTDDLPCGQAGIISFLVGVPSPNLMIDESSAESLLDAVLSNALRGSINESGWTTGLEQLRKSKRTALALESYLTYYRLLGASKTDLSALIELATSNFEKRRKDSYFSGGDQTEGGGPDNPTTVDYRLAAILKKLDYVGENPHRWMWN